MNNKFKLSVYIALLIGIVTVLSGCQTPVIFNPKGVISEQERTLILEAIGLMLLVVVPVIILVLVFAWKYRETNKDAKYDPKFYHSNTLEVIVWGIPIIIIAILATITWKTTHQLDPYKSIPSDEKPITVEVVALDWKWLFIYPEQNIATINFLEFPANVPLNLKVTADAPMNAFQIPQLGSQIYAMAGMQTKLHLMANESGDYEGRAVNYSGHGFYGMHFVARATSKEQFNEWVEQVKKSSEPLSDEKYNELVKPSYSNAVTTYYPVKNNLFKEIMAKFMPMDEDMHHSHNDDSSDMSH